MEVTPVVNVDGRLDVDAFDVPERAPSMASRSAASDSGACVVREVAVVLVHEAPGVEAAVAQLRAHGVVPDAR